jgi:hypothetical protein
MLNCRTTMAVESNGIMNELKDGYLLGYCSYLRYPN